MKIRLSSLLVLLLPLPQPGLALYTDAATVSRNMIMNVNEEYVEREWYRQLKEKYNVKIHNKVLNKAKEILQNE